MNIEWSDEALADLDRFAEFLDRQCQSLATRVAAEIISKVQVLAEHPRLDCRAGGVSADRFAGSSSDIRISVSV